MRTELCVVLLFALLLIPVADATGGHTLSFWGLKDQYDTPLEDKIVTVVDEHNRPVQGAIVWVEKGGEKVTEPMVTDERGHVYITLREGGEYEFYASMPNYTEAYQIVSINALVRPANLPPEAQWAPALGKYIILHDDGTWEEAKPTIQKQSTIDDIYEMQKELKNELPSQVASRVVSELRKQQGENIFWTSSITKGSMPDMVLILLIALIALVGLVRSHPEDERLQRIRAAIVGEPIKRTWEVEDEVPGKES